MKRLLSVLVVFVIVAVGVGFYRGWFTLSSPSPAVGSNKINVNLEADPDKMKEDVEKVKAKSTSLIDKGTDEVKEFGEKTSEKVKSVSQ